VLAANAEVRQVRARIRDETQKILRGLESEAVIARSREAALRRTLAELEQRLAEAEQAEATARDLERDAAATRSLYESLLARQKQVATQEGIQQADARVVSEAAVPLRASFPNRKLFLAVALMAATTSGVGLAMLRERSRQGFRSMQELEGVLGVRAIGEVPMLRGRAARRGGLAMHVRRSPRSLAAESMHTVRSRLALGAAVRDGRPPPRVLAVTSALPGEGKTSVALALARSFAVSGRSVLLVECDLRNRSLARDLGQGARHPGLLAILEGEASLEEVLGEAPGPGLRVLPAEREPHAQPQDLLHSERFRWLLERAEASFDYVVLDTPPLGVVSDALMLNHAVDAAVLVVRWESTPRDAAARALRSLDLAGIPVAGAVLNAADTRKSDYASGYPLAGQAVRRYFRE
jgi:capsular exopolysaccharide synthesis family protein